jgi:hypothetical protein
MLRIAFAGAFPVSLEEPVRQYLTTPCECVVASEADILEKLPEIDVLVTMGLTREMTRAAGRLKLVQVPGAGVDRIDRSALPAGVLLANAYGHETGIAEYVIGAMLALTREFSRLDAALRKGDWQRPVGSRHGSAASLAGTLRSDDRHSRLRADWSKHCPPRPRFRHAGLGYPARCRTVGGGRSGAAWRP